MTISLGLYDSFVNIVPGVLYLYVITEFLKAVGWRTIDLTQLDTLGDLLLVAVVSLILGNIVGSVTYKYWFKIFSRTRTPVIALKKVREVCPDIPLDFKPDDNDLIFAVIRHHDRELAEKIETARVNSIMLRSISFGLFIYSILQLWLVIVRQQALFLVIALGALMLSVIALNRSITFYKWFYVSIFLEALNYGNTMQEVLSVSKAIVSGNEIKKPKTRRKTTSQ